MGDFFKIHLLLVLWLLIGTHDTVSTKSVHQPVTVLNERPSEELFADEKILDIKISGELRTFNDRADQSSYHPVELSYKGADSTEIKIPLKARTRGHFRKSMGDCTYPPVLLNFSSKNTPAKSLFAGQDKLKLVMPCQGDQYVAREWMIYKLYNLVTDKSYKARLVRVEIDDSQRKKKTSPFYGILLEEDEQMAKRNKMVLVKRKMLKMNQTEKPTFLKMAVFEYLIGHTDWSVEYQQNVELLAKDSSSIPYTVPYDFDHAGLISAPYARPAEELEMSSVRERRYRGYCIPNMNEFKEVFEFYTGLKERIYELYRSNTYLDAKYVKSTLEYFDDFYKTIGDEKKAKSAFGYPCDKNGTGKYHHPGFKEELKQNYIEMKLLMLVAVAICIVSLPAKAQILDSTIAAYADNFAPERCYLHYDKSSYLPGETIWFKAYLMKGILPADESKTLYIEWMDDQGKLITRNISPVVTATTNGQFDIPDNYTGKFIHVKAYTKWMLNFDTAFLYDKDIRVLSKGPVGPAAKSTATASLDFFPEGGDIIEGLPNKIVFKSNDQFGRPVKIKGVVKNKAGATVDSLRVIHDGMGYFFLTPAANESFTAKWKDEKGADHTTALPATKPAGVSLQVTIEGAKRLFSVYATPDKAKGTFYIMGTMNQYQVFKYSKNISEGPIKATIPTQNLPTGILTITVFDEQWNPMAERITYVNNNDYLFQPEMTVQHWGLNKRARNEIQLLVPDSLPANFSVSVTDAGIDTDSSDNIISHLMLMGDIKGKVYNPAFYFSNVNDSTVQSLDLVMLTNGWRRFRWDNVVKGLLPKIIFPRDTSYLSLSGRVYGVLPSQLKENPDIIMIINQKNAKGKILATPIQPDGTFNEPSLVLFDTAHVYYRLSKGLESASASFLESKLPSLRYNPAAGSRFFNPGDTTGNARHFQLSDESIQLMKLYEGKVLENVIVKAKTKSPMEIMDEKYASGLFSGGDAYQFDLLTDPFASTSMNIFTYLQGKVAGLQVNTNVNPPTMTWRGGSPQVFVNEVATDNGMVATMTPRDIAYIKVFRPPFFGGVGGGAGGGIAIYTRKGGDVKAEPGKGLNNTVVTGYTELKQFYSPNYSTFNQANEKKDLRTTLYWNPQVIIPPGKNQAVLTFYNNDVSKAFRVIIEGMSSDGRLAHIEQIME